MKTFNFTCLAFLLLQMSLCAYGRAHVSFKRVVRPKIQTDKEIMAILSAFEIQDEGNCQFVDTGDPISKMKYDFPFIFPARPNGDTGPFRFLIVIDFIESISDTHNRIIAGRGTDPKDYHRFGVAIWPLASKRAP